MPTDRDRPALPDLPLSRPHRVAGLSGRKPLRFDLAPDAEVRARMAAALGLLDLPEFRFKGELRPVGRQDLELLARLEARAVQPCSVTLAPVPCRIDEEVRRRYLADWQEPEAEEAEIPEDDTAEPLPEVIDLGAVAIEALALALPLYPRAEGVDRGEAAFAPPGAAPLSDADLKPFAGLQALKSRLEGPGEDVP